MSAAPLAGVRVVTIALNLPGPVAAARLQELGADVVTVLPPSGDPVATLVPALYEELHRGQSVRTVDMKSQAGAAEMEQILAEADVFLTSHRSGALRRLGRANAVRRGNRARTRATMMTTSVSTMNWVIATSGAP